MAQNSRPTSLLDSLGEEIIRIVTPVSICMFLVVVLVSVLNEDSSNSASVSSIATIAYNESSSDSDWDKFIGALWNSLAFVGIVIVATFILVLLFYFRCTKLLKIYLGFSAFVVLGFLGGEVALFLITDYSFPIDCITFVVILLNFSVVGVIAVFMSKMAIFVTQGYLVVIGMLVAYWFTLLPEWTTWVLLVAMALYDLAAVLLPIGPLRILVELAISRDEEIPALVYEARPVTQNNSSNATGVARRRVWRETSAVNSDSIEDQNSGALDSDSVGNNQNGENLVSAEEGRHQERISELTAPLIEQRLNYHRQMQEEDSSGGGFPIERIGLGSSGAIKLGLGDFIFYSVLVGRAAMYDFMAVYACYLAIVAGLGVTLILLVLYQKALPALPVSIFLVTRNAKDKKEERLMADCVQFVPSGCKEWGGRRKKNSSALDDKTKLWLFISRLRHREKGNSPISKDFRFPVPSIKLLLLADPSKRSQRECVLCAGEKVPVKLGFWDQDSKQETLVRS